MESYGSIPPSSRPRVPGIDRGALYYSVSRLTIGLALIVALYRSSAEIAPDAEAIVAPLDLDSSAGTRPPSGGGLDETPAEDSRRRETTAGSERF